MPIDGFKQYNKISFKPLNVKPSYAKPSKRNNENDPQKSNVIQHTNPNGDTQRILNSGGRKALVTPGTLFKTNAKELTSDTNCSTNVKKSVERPPSMRIKRNSSKKSKLYHSNDSREKSACISNLRKSEEFGTTHTKYQNLSSKLDKSENIDTTNWDKRFIEYSTKAKAYDLLPKPDAHHLKKILENETDER
jgi:hypothetical protein